MIYKIYGILHRLLFNAGIQKRLHIIVPINIGASLALFTTTLIILIFHLLKLNLEFIISQRFNYIILLIFILSSIAFFLIKGRSNIKKELGGITARKNILIFIIYIIVTIVIPLLVFMNFNVGMYW